MVQLGYYAQDKDGNLFRFQWNEDNTFYIIGKRGKMIADPKNYEILEVGHYTADSKDHYPDFLFSQLFMNHVENNDTEYQELAYDLIYPEVRRHRQLFVESDFNVDIRSEYDCIVDYLKNQVK